MYQKKITVAKRAVEKLNSYFLLTCAQIVHIVVI